MTRPAALAGDAAPAAAPLPFLREQEAVGEAAALFAEIRAATGAPLVNLIWRHLATIEGALPWAWRTAAPLYRSAALPAAAAAVARALPPLAPAPPPWPRAALRAAGVDAEAETAIGAVLAAYQRGNGLNLVGLTALRLRLAGEAPPPSPGAARPQAAPLPPLAPVPPMPVAEELAPEVEALVQALNGLGPAPGRVVASLYRHLALWPGFLAMLWPLLAPTGADGSLAAQARAAAAAARAEARTLLGALDPATGLPRPALAAAIDAALTPFTDAIIARMVAVGRIIAAVMPAPGPAG